MPKGIYKKTQEHINKLKPHLTENFKKLKICKECGRFIGKKAHKCLTKEEMATLLRNNLNEKSIEKAKKTLKRKYDSGEIIPYWKGKKRDKKTKEKIRNTKLKDSTKYWLGKKMSEKAKKKMSKSHIGINKGKQHYNWKGGITNKVKQRWCSLDYQKWRKKVFERDDYTCQKCGKRSGKDVGQTIKLNAHHIKSIYNYPKLIYNVKNGKTLCVNCHTKYHKKNGFKNENKK